MIPTLIEVDRVLLSAALERWTKAPVYLFRWKLILGELGWRSAGVESLPVRPTGGTYVVDFGRNRGLKFSNFWAVLGRKIGGYEGAKYFILQKNLF